MRPHDEVEFNGVFLSKRMTFPWKMRRLWDLLKRFWVGVWGILFSGEKSPRRLPVPRELPPEKIWDGISGASVTGYLVGHGHEMDDDPTGRIPIPAIRSFEFFSGSVVRVTVTTLVERVSLHHTISRLLGAGKGSLVLRHHGEKGDSILMFRDIEETLIEGRLGVDDFVCEEKISFSAKEVIPWQGI
jgi:hypothetical protein